MTFLYPYVLIALALPALLGALAVYLHRRAGHAWQQLVSPAHPELVHRRPRYQVALPVALGLLALTGIILAAARPINGYTQGEGTATGRNLLIALDISRSMETQDVSPSRLEEARAAAYELIEALPGDKIGLIVFSGEADVVVPLTYDHTALRDALEQVNRDWAGYGGTNFGLLLRCAMQNFARSAPDGANALVILSDGEDTVESSLQTAEEAKKNNLLVITVGIGSPTGGAIPDPQGENGLWQDANGHHVISKLDIAALRRFADATGGDFFTMSSGADLSAFAREAVNKLEKHEENYATGRVPLDLFAWFAAPSLLALLVAIILGTEWRMSRRSAAMLVALLLMAPVADASAPSSYAQGVQALRDGQTDEAREKLSEALLSDDESLQAAAHLALGNIQTRNVFEKLRQLYEPGEEEKASSPGIEALQGIIDELEKARIPYRDALRADASLAAAQHNIDKVQALIRKIEEEIERLKQQQNQDQQKDDQQQQGDQDQQKDDQQQAQGSEPENTQEGNAQGMSIQPQELSEEEKGKQRAAGILRMHLDEEKGSPIPHDNRAVRPPAKDY